MKTPPGLNPKTYVRRIKMMMVVVVAMVQKPQGLGLGVNLGSTPHPVMVTTRDCCRYIKAL